MVPHPDYNPSRVVPQYYYQLLRWNFLAQAVDSSIEALPYWDYSRDVAPLKSNYTSIFSAKYFGSYVGEAPDYSIIDGEFGHWPILKDTDTNEPLLHKNVYGYQRHPLSLNKSPYLTRRGGSICGYNIGLGDPQMWNLCLNSGEIGRAHV